MAELANRFSLSPRLANVCHSYSRNVNVEGEGEADGEAPRGPDREAETPGGVVERLRAGSEGGKERRPRWVGGRRRLGAGRRDRKSQLLYSWLVIL